MSSASKCDDLGRVFLVSQPWTTTLPIPSMYGIYTYIWLILIGNVGKYTSPMDGMGLQQRHIMVREVFFFFGGKKIGEAFFVSVLFFREDWLMQEFFVNVYPQEAGIGWTLVQIRNANTAVGRWRFHGRDFQILPGGMRLDEIGTLQPGGNVVTYKMKKHQAIGHVESPGTWSFYKGMFRMFFCLSHGFRIPNEISCLKQFILHYQQINKSINIWRFPKIVVPQNHPF